MARHKSREALENELKAIRAKIEAFDKAERERIGQLAIKAGIGSIAISDDALTKELEGIVARFREAHPDLEERKTKGRRGVGSAPESSGDEAA